jgi:hypothetical protein
VQIGGNGGELRKQPSDTHKKSTRHQILSRQKISLCVQTANKSFVSKNMRTRATGTSEISFKRPQHVLKRCGRPGDILHDLENLKNHSSVGDTDSSFLADFDDRFVNFP